MKRTLLEMGDEVKVLHLTKEQQREGAFKVGNTYRVACDYEDLIYLQYPDTWAKQAIPFEPDQISLV